MTQALTVTTSVLKKADFIQGMVTHASNLSTWEVEVGRPEFKAVLSFTAGSMLAWST